MFNKTQGNGKVTGDGSQYFLKGSGPYDMWDGDGNHYFFNWQVTGYDDSLTNYTHDFGIGRNGWYLSSVTDPFGTRTGLRLLEHFNSELDADEQRLRHRLADAESDADEHVDPEDITLPSASTIYVVQGNVNGVDGMIDVGPVSGAGRRGVGDKTWTLANNATLKSVSRTCTSPSAIVVPLQVLEQFAAAIRPRGAPKYEFTYAINGSLSRSSDRLWAKSPTRSGSPRPCRAARTSPGAAILP